LGRAYGETIGTYYPAMAVVQVAGLVEKAARIEVEATAVIPE
jgi:enamine deaminase RidA (YjgF/YER057c/UK114 family)